MDGACWIEGVFSFLQARERFFLKTLLSGYGCTLW